MQIFARWWLATAVLFFAVVVIVMSPASARIEPPAIALGVPVGEPSSAPATVAILSGESDMTLTNYVAAANHIAAGKLRILGITSAKRSPRIANVPTFINLYGYGYENIYELSGAYSIEDSEIDWVSRPTYQEN